MKTPVQHSPSERGSALLIVLVMAAVIAIMLYRELPVATFEAQRQKEQLLINRGNEYSRAVKLYVRKFQSYPPTLDALENTNRMRFLRFRYVDPYTGKADWRLLHAGPGGMIVDSKLKKTGLTGLGGAQGGGSQLGAAAASANFSNSINFSDQNGAGPAANNFPQRPPTVSASQVGAPDAPPPVDPNAAQNQTQMQPPLPPGMVLPTQTGSMPSNSLNTGNPMATSSGQYGAGNPGRFRGGNPAGNSYPPGQFNGPSTDPNSGIDTQAQGQNLINNGNPPPAINNNFPGSTNNGFPNQSSTFTNNNSQGSGGTPSSGVTSPTTGTTGTMGGNVGGGIAGVASKTEGHTIKSINDQTERSLWEFVYDMQKEATANAPAVGGANTGGATPPPTNSQTQQ